MKRIATILVILFLFPLFFVSEGSCWGERRCKPYKFAFKGETIYETKKDGECLFSVAKKYNVYPWQIAKWNNLSRKRKSWRYAQLRKGIKLRIRLINWAETLRINDLGLDYKKIASFYGRGDGFAGKVTASGMIFNPRKMVAAHPLLPPNKNFFLKVTNLERGPNYGKSVVVWIIDKGPTNYHVRENGRVIDLSWGAMRKISRKDLIHVKVEIFHILQTGKVE